MKTIEEMKQTMQEYLGARFPDRRDLTVTEMERTTGAGYSYETYLLQLTWNGKDGRGSEGLVVRMEPETGLVPPYDVRPQYEVLKRVHGSGIPVPEVYWLETDGSILGRPFFLMERIEGGNFNTYYFTHPDQQKQMQEDYIQLLHKLHGLDWRALDFPVLTEPEDSRAFARKQLARWEWVIEEHLHYPIPLLTELLTWAKTHIPPAERTALCHGDFHTDNFFVRDGQIAALLDWEMTDLGDPVIDVAWAFLFSRLFGIWGADDVVRKYEEVSGAKLNEESLLFWKVFAYIRIIAIFSAGIKAGMETDDPNMKLVNTLVGLLPGVLHEGAQLLGI